MYHETKPSLTGICSRITPQFIFYAISYKIIWIPDFSLIITTFFDAGRSFNFCINIEQLFFVTLFQISRYHRQQTSDTRSRSTLRNHEVVYLHHSSFFTGFSSSFRAKHNQYRNCSRRRNVPKISNHPGRCYGRNRQTGDWRSQCRDAQRR